MQEFSFSYMASKTDVRLDDTTVYITVGPINKKTEIPLKSIKNFYIKDYGDYKEFIIRYEKANGKIKNRKLLGGLADAAMGKLGDALAEKLPGIDLRKYDSREAMQMMKASDSQKMGFWIALIVIIAVVTVIMMPGLLHYLDNGHETVSVDEIISGKDLSTHNLTLTGTVLNQGMEETTTSKSRGSTSTTVNNYFPLIPEDYQKGDEIHILLETGDMLQSEVDDFVEKSSFSGTLKDIWWEGVGSSQEDFFKENYDITFADDVMLFEVCNGKCSYTSIIYIWGGMVLILLIVFIIMKVMMNRNKD